MPKPQPNGLATARAIIEEPTGLSFTATARARRVLINAGATPEVMQALGLDDNTLKADRERLQADRNGEEPARRPVRW